MTKPLRKYQQDAITKICSKCGIEKPLTAEYFYFRKDNNKFRNVCKVCVDLKNKNNYLEKKDYYLSYKKEWYEKNKELSVKENSIKNREHILKRKKEYREKNRDEINNKKRQWNKDKKEHIINYGRDYVKNKKQSDPIYKLKNDIRKNFSSSFKRCSKNKTETFFSYTGIKFNEYVLHLQNFELWNAFCNGENIHIDHIIPCSAYDFNNPEEIKKCWNPENLRLITAEENLKKGESIDFDLIEKHNIKHLLPEKLK